VIQFNLIVERSEDVCNVALFGNWRNKQFEVGDVCTFETVKDGPYVDELADLFPLFGSSHQPTKEWWVDLGTVSTKQHQVLTERKI
jgi:hypothetical protein